MDAGALVVLMAVAGCAAACAQKPGDPPPPAPKYGVMSAPPGALGAHAAAAQTPGAAALEPEQDEDGDPEGFDEPQGPTPGVAPEEGVPL